MKRLIWPAMSLLLTHCGSLVPTIDQVTDNSGAKAVIRNEDAIVLLRYARRMHQHLVFHLEIENHTEDTIHLDAEHIRYFASGRPFVPVVEAPDDWQRLSSENSQLPFVMQFAMSKEQVMSSALQSIRRKQTMGYLFTLFATGLAAYDDAEDSEDFHQEYVTEGDIRRGVARDVAVASAFAAAGAVRASAYAEGRRYDNLFYELFPGRSILPFGRKAGDFYISMDRIYKYYRIVLQIRGDYYVFDFTRRRVENHRP